MNLNKIKIDISIINHYIGGFIIIFQHANNFPLTYFQKILIQ